jgi:hypothetical protein
MARTAKAVSPRAWATSDATTRSFAESVALSSGDSKICRISASELSADMLQPLLSSSGMRLGNYGKYREARR